ncbi:hypothetical protein [Streptomyces sp. bgisy091]|uniref:hypothetical protein n=1 Tax=Streptomyces sp. bgisy091 TaxID=3413778 RepID=UPI003D714196
MRALPARTPWGRTAPTAVVLAVLAALLVLVAPGQAHAAGTVTATPTTVAPGETFTLNYSVDSPFGPNGEIFFDTLDGASLPEFTTIVSCTGNTAPCFETGNQSVVPVGDFDQVTTISGSLTLRVDAGTPPGQFTVGWGRQSDFGAEFTPAGPTVTVVAAQADLASSTALTGSLLGAGTIGVSAGVTNNGPAGANDVSVTTTLPSQTTGVSGLPGGCAYNSTAKSVTCGVATLANAQSATFTYTVSVSLLSLGALPVSTTASATNPDPTPGNNASGGSCTVVTSLVILC